MSSIQAWVLQLCGVCIICSVLFTFIKNEKVNNSIKTVLALYILVTALNPLLKTDYNLEKFEQAQSYTVQEVDAQSLIKEKATNEIVRQVNDMFKSLNIDASCNKIELLNDLSDVSNAQIILKSNIDEKKAVDAVKNLLGNSVIINVVYKE